MYSLLLSYLVSVESVIMIGGEVEVYDQLVWMIVLAFMKIS